MLCSKAFSLSLCHPDSAPQPKKDDDSKRHNVEGRHPICPEARLRLRMARVRLESPTSWHGSRESVYLTRYSCHGAPRRLLAPTNLATPPEDACVSCEFSSVVCCPPKRRDTCIKSRQPHRLSIQIEKNKIARRDVKRRLSVSMSLNRPLRVL